MTDSYKHFVPQTLNEPPKFLFWDMDVAMVFFVALGFGIFGGQLILGTSIGFYLAWRYGRAKSGGGPGYGIHLCYWHLPVGIKFKRVPPSSTRNFLG